MDVAAIALAAHARPAIVAVERATFANEPVTVGKRSDGRLVRALGGKNARGGTTFIAGTIPFWTPIFPQGTWPVSSLPVSLYVALPKSRDLGDAEDAELEVAARAWNHLPCTAFRAHVAGTTSIGPGDDGTSGVYFEDGTWPSEFTPGALATTVVHVDAQGHIYDADVYVNGADHVFSRDGHGTTADFRSIATHEIGHVLGLGESADPIATMYTAYPPGVAWRSLEQDDEDGACTLYPGAGDLLGCEATSCPTDFICVARTCERDGDQRMLCSPCEPSDLRACEGAGETARCVPYAAGFACGRPCATSDDCGNGFACTATTEAGDFQCLASDSCATAANPCATVAECNDPDDAGWICSAGACLGALAGDAGDDAGDASSPDADAGDVPVPRGGCSLSETSTRSPFAFAAFAALAFAIRRRQSA